MDKNQLDNLERENTKRNNMFVYITNQVRIMYGIISIVNIADYINLLEWESENIIKGKMTKEEIIDREKFINACQDLISIIKDKKINSDVLIDCAEYLNKFKN